MPVTKVSFHVVWLNWLSPTEFWYNSWWHSAISYSAFEAMYGYSPMHFGIFAADVVQYPVTYLLGCKSAK
jgi:hypothetical protein